MIFVKAESNPRLLITHSLFFLNFSMREGLFAIEKVVLKGCTIKVNALPN